MAEITVSRKSILIKWKSIDGFPNCFVSNNGLVRKGNLLVNQRAHEKHWNRLSVTLFNEKNKPRRFFVHLLVFDHFSTEKRIKGNEVHHIDLDCQNNHIDNLKQLTHSEHLKIHQNG